MNNQDTPVELSLQTHWEFAAQTRMGKYLTKLETDFICKNVDMSLKNLTVMDVGAEAGRFSLLAANENTTVVSIDLDLYALKRLRLKNRTIHIIQADAKHLPLKDGVFDLIFMVEVLDYISKLDEALLDCKRALKPNASSILSFGNKSSLKAKLKAMQGKSYRHSYGEVMGCLLKTGFVVKDKLGYSWLPFGRTSQSRIIPFLAGIERLFGLRRIVKYSPWVIIHVVEPA